MTKKVSKVIVLSLLISMNLFVSSVFAGNYTCSGKVTLLAFSQTGGILQVNAGHGVHYLCKLHTQYNGVDSEICKAWYSMFLTAQASGREVHQSYSDAQGDAANCSELGTWVTPNPMPYFVYLKDQ